MKSLLGANYDYTAYVDLALDAIGVTPQWTDYNGEDVPVHFICSAVADWVYERRGLPNPGGYLITRYTTPAEWAQFVVEKQWNS
jgi:hypothetical protein